MEIGPGDLNDGQEDQMARSPVEPVALELHEEYGRENQGNDDRPSEQQLLSAEKSSQERRCEKHPRSPPNGSRKGSAQKERTGSNEETLCEDNSGQSAKAVDAVRCNLKEPVHVDPRPPCRGHRERIDAQDRMRSHNLPPGRQVPPQVAIRDRRKACRNI